MLLSVFFLGQRQQDPRIALPKSQSGIVPKTRYRKFGELGAKKVFSYTAMKRFVVQRHFRPPDPTFFNPEGGG
jgi:hypothetical protein